MVVNYICISTSSLGRFSKNSNNFWARRKISRTSKNILWQHHFQYSLKLKFISITNKRNIFFHRGGWDGGGRGGGVFIIFLFYCTSADTMQHHSTEIIDTAFCTVLQYQQYYSTTVLILEQIIDNHEAISCLLEVLFHVY